MLKLTAEEKKIVDQMMEEVEWLHSDLLVETFPDDTAEELKERRRRLQNVMYCAKVLELYAAECTETVESLYDTVAEIIGVM